MTSLARPGRYDEALPPVASTRRALKPYQGRPQWSCRTEREAARGSGAEEVKEEAGWERAGWGTARAPPLGGGGVRLEEP